MNDFIKEQQKLARKEMFRVTTGRNTHDPNDLPEKWGEELDTLITQIITNTGAEIMRRVEGEKTKDTDGKTYYSNHPDVIKDKALDTIKQHIKDLTQ